MNASTASNENGMKQNKTFLQQIFYQKVFNAIKKMNKFY